MFRFRHKPSRREESVRLLVGLGNPGATYAETRHNIGFMVISQIAEDLEIRARRSAHQALIGEARLAGKRLLLAQPQTYMNRSGLAVAALMRFYKLTPGELLVICDDLDLPLGRLRLRGQGGDGGHRGLRSIIECLGTKEFPRLRVGVSRPPTRMETVDYVLTRFVSEEQVLVKEVLAAAAEGTRQWWSEGLEKAMNRVNAWSPTTELNSRDEG